jgi:hypothetical protein
VTVSYSDILASTALAVSLLTAGWTTLNAWRWNRPVVSVSGGQWIGERIATPSRLFAGFSLEVVNIGNHPTQIIAASWQIDRGTSAETHFYASHESDYLDKPDLAKAPILPFTLERYGRRAWDFDIGLDGIREHEAIIRARPVVQFTSRKKTQFAYGAWQSSQIALYARHLSEDYDA